MLLTASNNAFASVRTGDPPVLVRISSSLVAQIHSNVSIAAVDACASADKDDLHTRANFLDDQSTMESFVALPSSISLFVVTKTK